MSISKAHEVLDLAPHVGMETETIEVDGKTAPLSNFDSASSGRAGSDEKKPNLEVTSLADSQVSFDDDTAIIVTGTDAANHLLSLRDDKDPALTFRSIFLASILSSFQAVMTQIYYFKPTKIDIYGPFIVIIAYVLGVGWAKVFPRGDVLLARWTAQGGHGKRPIWISLWLFLNPCAWSLKEHAITSITATSASNAHESVVVFAAQKLFYDMEVSATTVILAVLSIGLFGYGLAGLFRPIMVWHVDAVYWSTLPTVKVLQGMHWQSVKNSKPLRWFWYSFIGMFFYEIFPAYMFPWLNSVSIPCLAASHATGSKGETLTRFFGGASNNEGLGLFTVSFDWQYITSGQTSLPLKWQAHYAVGIFTCMLAMIGIYYTDTWGSKSLPFMSTKLLSADGSKYPIHKVFVQGELDQAAFATYGVPKMAGSFAYGQFMANAAIGALIAHVILFWAGDVKRAFKGSRKSSGDRHHVYMAAHYKEVPWWWYALLLAGAFALGTIVVTTQNITLPFWGFFVSILTGCIIAPFSTLLYSRFGSGIATNNLSKLMAGLLLPGRPVGNMYFASWSHSVIINCVNLSNDLKLGEYLKIPPRVMFLTQLWGTVLGGFINYVVMSSIISENKALLTDTNGNSSWSGATIQGYNTNATSWALARYLYTYGKEYYMVPLGLLVGASIVAAHRIFTAFVPRIGKFATNEINFPLFIQAAGYIPYNASQTCVIFSTILAGFFIQFYLRNYKPAFFKHYMYMITGAFDGGALWALFILSFAVFGAAGKTINFPAWWGNNVNGNYDHCPSSG
ncbi:unnamed protein product [Zymoseptoria tritici ST99CH_1E4]|uniref:OPT family small oligopeptide transporter n=1 Tax=Zymoseptoria tritici ST99CH_1E4 TaxID=1276532 RepID=A0A2H1G3N4_ZYMTR|nr:unnamed protein product [Zymoseptoria tritici ST99CH_1E4]